MNKSFKFPIGKMLSFASLLVIGSCFSPLVLQAMEEEGDISFSKKRPGSDLDSQVSQKKVKDSQQTLSPQIKDPDWWLPSHVNSYEGNWNADSMDYSRAVYGYGSHLQSLPPQVSEKPFTTNNSAQTNNNSFQVHPNITNDFSKLHPNFCTQINEKSSVDNMNKSTSADVMDIYLNNNFLQTPSHGMSDFCFPVQPYVGNSSLSIIVESFANSLQQNNTAQSNQKKPLSHSPAALDVQLKNNSLQIKDAQIELNREEKSSTSGQQKYCFNLTFNTEFGQQFFKLSDADLMQYVINNSDKKLINDVVEIIKSWRMYREKQEFHLKIFKLIFGETDMVLPQAVHKQFKDFLNPEIFLKKRKKILREFLGYKKKEGQTEKWIKCLHAASEFVALKQELNHGTLERHHAEIVVIPKTAHMPEFPHKAADIGFLLTFDSVLGRRTFKVRESELIDCVPQEEDRNFIIKVTTKVSDLEMSQRYLRRSKLKCILFQAVFKEGVLSQNIRNQLQFLWKSSGSNTQILALVDDFIENPTSTQQAVVIQAPYQNGSQPHLTQSSSPLQVATQQQQQGAPLQLANCKWYFMTYLDNLAGQSAESMLRSAVPVEPVVCLNDKQLNALKYQGIPLMHDNEKWYVINMLKSMDRPVDVELLEAFVPISSIAYLSEFQLEWLKNQKNGGDTLSQT